MKFLQYLAVCVFSCLSFSCAVAPLDLFAIPDPGEEFSALTVNGDQVFAATEHYLYRLSANLTELQRKLFIPSTRLLLLSNTSDSLLVCGADCVVVSPRNLERLWPSPDSQGEIPEILDPSTNREDVGFEGVLQTGRDPNGYLLTYAQDRLFDEAAGGAAASQIVRGYILGDSAEDPVAMTDTFQVVAVQREKNLSTERRFIHTFSRNRFSYLVSVVSDGDSVQAKIVRICDSDTGDGGNFTSYIELGLYCGDSSGQPTSAVYVPSPNAFGYDALVLSVGVERLSEVRNRLCAFRLAEIDRKMNTKIDECAGGVGTKGLRRNMQLEPCVIVKVGPGMK